MQSAEEVIEFWDSNISHPSKPDYRAFVGLTRRIARENGVNLEQKELLWNACGEMESYAFSIFGSKILSLTKKEVSQVYNYIMRR